MDLLAKEDIARTMRVLSAFGLANYVGGSWYILYAAHPSAMELEAKEMSKFRQGTVIRALPLPMSYLGSMALAAGSYLVSSGTPKHDIGWVIAASGIFITIPFTFKFMLPINNKFRDGEVSDDEGMALLEKWNSFHFPRTLFMSGILMFMLYRLST